MAKDDSTANPITLDTILEPAKSVVGRLIDQEALIVVAEQGRAKVLNEVAPASGVWWTVLALWMTSSAASAKSSTWRWERPKGT